LPFIITLELVVDKRTEIQFLHDNENPCAA
jgi:hypothetical protein